eukprot:scaffold16579_cov58-Phaeocystis_antarctica.AAC.5
MGLSECENCDGTNFIYPDNGSNRWVAGPPSNQSYVVLRDRQTAQDALDTLLCQPRLADLPSPPAQPPALPPVPPQPQPTVLPSPTAASTNTDSSGHAHKHKEKSQDGGVHASVANAADGVAATRGTGTPTANLPLTVAVAVTLLLALAVAPHGQIAPLEQCPTSSPVPPQGTPGGSGQLGASRGSDRLTGRPATASVARARRLQSRVALSTAAAAVNFRALCKRLLRGRRATSLVLGLGLGSLVTTRDSEWDEADDACHSGARSTASGSGPAHDLD